MPTGEAPGAGRSDFGANQALADALIDYVEFPVAQSQALMVRGKRGGGKSHLVREVLASLSATHRVLFISLYGIHRTSDIDALIYQCLHPVLSRGGHLLSIALRGVSNLLGGDETGDLAISGLLSGPARTILVFDDFERCFLPPPDILAYIDPFMTVDGSKVVIVVNEDELDAQDARYVGLKHRMAGRILDVAIDPARAFWRFLSDLADPEARAFCERHEAAIRQVFADSEFDDLSLLRRGLWDFEKLFRAAGEAHRANEAAMLELALVLLAMSFELRSGRLDRSLLWRDTSTYYALPGSGPEDERVLSAGEMFKRYPRVKFDSGLLTTDTLAGMILQGSFPAEEIRLQLDAHPVFTDPARLPSWRALWFAFAMNDADAAAAVERFAEDFKNRRFTEEGEILHAAGLCIWLALSGDRIFSAEHLDETLKAYIDDVFDTRESTVADLFPVSGQFTRMAAAHGLMFRCPNEEPFRTAASLLGQKVDAWRERAQPAAAAELVALMSRDPGQFLREICHSGAGPARFARLPVLRLISPDHFAAAFMAQTPPGRETILSALGNRYSDVMISRGLAAERGWLRLIYERLMEIAASLPPVSRSHLTGALDHYLIRALAELEKDSARPW